MNEQNPERKRIAHYNIFRLPPGHMFWLNSFKGFVTLTNDASPPVLLFALAPGRFAPSLLNGFGISASPIDVDRLLERRGQAHLVAVRIHCVAKLSSTTAKRPMHQDPIDMFQTPSDHGWLEEPGFARLSSNTSQSQNALEKVAS